MATVGAGGDAEPTSSHRPGLVRVLKLERDRAYASRPDVKEAKAERDRARSKRPDRPRPKTVSNSRISKRALEDGRSLYPDMGEQRPRTRGDCNGVPRPCPFVSCQWHLYLDVTDTGSLKFNFPDLEPGELAESCALDVAERGGATLETVSAIMNFTRQRAQQVERIAIGKIAPQMTALVNDTPIAGRIVRLKMVDR